MAREKGVTPPWRAGSKNAITFVSSVLTWQAYNQWGGYSLYKGPNRQRGSRSMIASLSNTKSILYGGHGEYWTANMRTNIASAIDRGVNFVSLGGNAAYAHPRLQANNRQIVMWRSSLADPN